MSSLGEKFDKFFMEHVQCLMQNESFVEGSIQPS